MILRDVRRTYRWMAPVYDALFRRFYREMRQECIAALGLGRSDIIVLVGVGTGLDVPLLPLGSRILAVDVTPEMLGRVATSFPGQVDCVLADGAALPLRDASVSAVVFHLVLSVAPDPAALMLEATRVLRAGGQVAILDHFARPGRLGVTRSLLAKASGVLGTHFDRRFEELPVEPRFAVIRDRRLARGWYRALVLRRLDD